MSEQAIRPNKGPQETFLRCNAREALFGGAAGGGKSFSILLDATRHVENAHYRALLLRRTYPDLEQSLIDKSQFYSGLGARYKGDTHTWHFPSGARIRFGHLQHENDKHKYAGSEYQYIAFDELTLFTESQYLFLWSRLRSPYGIPTYMRATTNPDGPGLEWVRRRWAPWVYPPGEQEYDGPRAKPGERLYYRRVADDEVLCPADWYDPHCDDCQPGAACAGHRPLSRTFIPARVSDNPFLAGTDYEANLEALDPLTRERLRDGNWMSRPSAGKYFQRANFDIIPRCPADVIARVRYWDRAATKGGGAATAGVRMSVLESGLFVVEDVARAHLGPGEVKQFIRTTAAMDPPGTVVWLEQDPGQAGLFEIHTYVTELVGYDVRALPPQGDKEARARPVSAQSAARNIVLVAGAWNEPYIRELEGFPFGQLKDQVDATSGSFRVLVPELEAFRRRRPTAVRVRMLSG